VAPRSTFAEFRLPPGRHGIPPEEVAANQKWRILGAVTEVLAESGRLRTTSTAVARRASVSPATFYQHFENISDCLEAAFDVADDCIWTAITGACTEPKLEWRRRLREALDAALRFLAAEPELAHMLGSEAASAERGISAARIGLQERLASLLAETCGDRDDGEKAREAGQLELGLVGATFEVVSERIEAGEAAELPKLAPDLTKLIAEAISLASAPR
jgi:AcrR family transcriptional regulator